MRAAFAALGRGLFQLSRPKLFGLVRVNWKAVIVYVFTPYRMPSLSSFARRPGLEMRFSTRS